MVKLAIYIVLIGLLSGCFSNVYEEVEKAADNLYDFNGKELKNINLFSLNYTKKLDNKIIRSFGEACDDFYDENKRLHGLVRILMWDELLAFASTKTKNGIQNGNSQSEILINSNILSSDIRYIMETSRRKSEMAYGLIKQSRKDNKKELDFLKGLSELKKPESKEKLRAFSLCVSFEVHTTIRDLNPFYRDLTSTIKKALHQDTMNNLYNSFN
tara:strand:- start:744 stop:1385 length:642 start_codon:yes stop_codon:yes gene_type:complete